MTKFLSILLGCILCLLSKSASAMVPTLYDEWSKRHRPIELTVGSMSYSKAGFRQAANAQFAFESLGDGLQYQLDTDTLYTFNQPKEWYLSPANLWAGGYHHEEGLGISFGRKTYDWNVADQFWNLGILQPVMRWDPLRPQSVGLVGVFLEAHLEGVDLMAFGSPVFIPEQGPPYELKNGVFQSSSPWFVAPTENYAFYNNQGSVRYTIEREPLSKYLWKPSAGGYVRVGGKAGLFSRIAYAYKPMNQTLLAYTGELDSTTDTANIRLRPRAVYHQVLGMDLGWEQRHYGLWASGLFDRPGVDPLTADWTKQVVSETTTLAVGGHYRLFGTSSRFPRLQLSYLRTLQEDLPDVGPLANGGSQSTATKRYPFKEALHGQIQSGMPGAALKSFQLSGSLTRDLVGRGSVLSTSIQFQPIREWIVYGGLDVLGAQSNESSIARIRGNDRIYGGMQYVF